LPPKSSKKNGSTETDAAVGDFARGSPTQNNLYTPQAAEVGLTAPQMSAGSESDRLMPMPEDRIG
jgi:hypothetical protein